MPQLINSSKRLEAAVRADHHLFLHHKFPHLEELQPSNDTYQEIGELVGMSGRTVRRWRNHFRTVVEYEDGALVVEICRALGAPHRGHR